MATTIRAQVAWRGDTAFPRDMVSINPHFQVATPFTDFQSLADDLANAMATLTKPSSTSREIAVSLYDAKDPPPNTPKATKVLNAGVAPASTAPRELAMCLSYYAGTNTPRHRGRLYLPMHIIWGGSTFDVRPTSQMRDVGGQFVTKFAQLGGVDVDWVVFSRVDNTTYTVTNWYVDDEWDVVRSRGLRATTRTAGTTSG